jgi:hypothetical protein
MCPAKGILLFIVCATFSVTLGQETAKSIPVGSYEEMEPAQARLIDDWFNRFNKIMGESLDPREEFDKLPMSVKTTYQAVTNALITTELTNQAGGSLGTALDLVQHVDTVQGKVKKAGGDKQFRMYCRLKEGAREILEESVEFKRGRDNTVYHKGYPLNYRQQGGVPSIQISMSTDETSADIDVDYRSSKFPAALFNGHLTSANSDVRSGNNYERHSNRWGGLQDWWVNWFALPFVRKEMLDDADRNEIIPATPPKGRAKVEEAAFDFFHSWIVEQNPEIAMSYVSDRVFKCMELETGEPLDVGMAPFQMLVGLRKVNEGLGSVMNLTDVMTGVRISDPELRVVEQPHHGSFVLYDAAESKAVAFDCANRGLPENEVPKGSKTRFGKYFGTVHYIRGPEGQGETVGLLWAKEDKSWKIIAYEAEPAADDSDIPDLRPAIAAGEITRVNGKPKQIEAAKGFLNSWFIDKDYDRTLDYFAAECLQCINLFLEEGEQPFHGEENLRNRLRLGLKRTAEALGSYQRLGEVIRGIEAANPEFPIVSHSEETDFTLLAAADYVAGNYGCALRLGKGESLPAPDNPRYGNFYVLGFEVKTFTGKPAVLFTLWGQKLGQWKIISFDIEMP